MNRFRTKLPFRGQSISNQSDVPFPFFTCSATAKRLHQVLRSTRYKCSRVLTAAWYAAHENKGLAAAAAAAAPAAPAAAATAYPWHMLALPCITACRLAGGEAGGALGSSLWILRRYYRHTQSFQYVLQ